MNIKEKLGGMSAITAIMAVLMIGGASAAVVTYFDSAEATAQVDAPIEFDGDAVFENFDTSAEQTFETTLLHTGENAVGLDDHIRVTADYEDGYDSSGDLEDAIETLRLEVEEVDGDGEQVYALNPEEGEAEFSVVTSEDGEFEVHMDAYTEVDQDFYKDVVIELDDAATPGDYTIELEPHVESSVE